MVLVGWTNSFVQCPFCGRTPSNCRGRNKFFVPFFFDNIWQRLVTWLSLIFSLTSIRSQEIFNERNEKWMAVVFSKLLRAITLLVERYSYPRVCGPLLLRMLLSGPKWPALHRFQTHFDFKAQCQCSFTSILAFFHLFLNLRGWENCNWSSPVYHGGRSRLHRDSNRCVTRALHSGRAQGETVNLHDCNPNSQLMPTRRCPTGPCFPFFRGLGDNRSATIGWTLDASELNFVCVCVIGSR